ncbi:cysteine desulfurase [bacterium]|nr:cysteine desulfurase [bacterium]
MQERIYMDNSATTRTDPAVVEAMIPYFTDQYAVASSQFSHTPGIQAREALDQARAIIAGTMHADPESVVFTSGGTESNNLALKGTAWAFRGKKDHLIVSKTVHNSVLHSAQWLEKQGFRVTYADVDDQGFVDPDDIAGLLTDQTFLVSVQHANHETGTLQDIGAISDRCRKKEVLFHVDACRTLTMIELDLGTIPADLVSVSSHLVHGPKGVGALYIRPDTKIQKWQHGGYHEFDRRAGTENVAGAVGFGKAVELTKPEHTEAVRDMQKDLLDGLMSGIEGTVLNGAADLSRRHPGNVNVSFNRIEGESVVLHLDMKGISVITGSACFSRSLEPSYVMMAMGFTHERAHGSIRFTLSRFNRPDEIDRVVESSREVVEALRRISPLK